MIGGNILITIHAGHNPSGKIACGASDFLDESTASRELVKLVCKYFKKYKIQYKDITVRNGKSQQDILKKLVKRANKCDSELNVSIHFNSHKHSTRDGKTTGTECWVHESHIHKNGHDDIAQLGISIAYNISTCGFRNRGCKTSNKLYFLNKTKSPSVLIETCFVSDQDDAEIYNANKKLVAKRIAQAIACYVNHEL